MISDIVFLSTNNEQRNLLQTNVSMEYEHTCTSIYTCVQFCEIPSKGCSAVDIMKT